MEKNRENLFFIIPIQREKSMKKRTMKMIF